MAEKNSINGRPVPRWVITVSYVIGWVFGALILLHQLFGIGYYRPVLIITGIYLIFLPLIREGPTALLKRFL